MTKPCLSSNQGMNDDEIILPEFEPEIGAPFKVVLIESVRQKLALSGEVVSTCIPNMGGLLKEVALARSLHDRKFSAGELKFIRKAIGLKANVLAELLGVSPEHLSRCENGDRTLSTSAEKLLRVIVIKRRYNYAAISEAISQFLADENAGHERRDHLKQVFEEYNKCILALETSVFESKIDAAHDIADKLCFEFKLRTSPANENHSQDEEEWKVALAA